MSSTVKTDSAKKERLRKMKTFRITYLSGQSLLTTGTDVEQVAKEAWLAIAKFAIGRPHVGIKSVEEVKK